MITLDPSRWRWCHLCQEMSYPYPCCDQWTCTGGGCGNEQESVVCDAVRKARDDGNVPVPSQEEKDAAKKVHDDFWKEIGE